NFEANASYTIHVTATDAGGQSSTKAITISLNDVNEAPTAVNLNNPTATLAENTSTASRVKIADIVVSDDALGTNALALTGADAASFEIYNGGLYLKAGVALDFETKTNYAVTVTADDTSVGNSPDSSKSFTLGVSDVDEAPSALAFTNVTAS